jgi:hypothetical protein
MKRKIKNLIKEIKGIMKKNNFTGSSYKSKGSIQSLTKYNWANPQIMYNQTEMGRCL